MGRDPLRAGGFMGMGLGIPGREDLLGMGIPGEDLLGMGIPE